ERRKRRSFAVTSKLRRGWSSFPGFPPRPGRTGAVTLVSADDWDRLTKPTTASSVTFISNPAARAFSRHASTFAFSATAAAIASASSRANRFTTSSILLPPLRRRAGFRGRFPISCLHQGGGQRSGARRVHVYRKELEVA